MLADETEFSMYSKIGGGIPHICNGWRCSRQRIETMQKYQTWNRQLFSLFIY